LIRFSLSCANGHGFEGWFGSSQAFDDQQSSGQLACPSCGSTHIHKALMAPAVSTARKKESVRVSAHVPPGPEPEPLVVMRKLRQQLIEGADYVGDRFAEEARRIHYNEVEKRGIYGEASPEDVRSLAEEGIAFHPLPVLPEDHN
jgi:hypothetical protein